MRKTIFLAIFSIFMASPLLASASFNRDLSYGSNGADVYDLQDILQELNCFHANSTGYFGPLTVSAVECYQTNKGISSTGYVGPLTRASLNSYLDSLLASSTQEQIQTTGSTTVSTQPFICPVGFNCIPKTSESSSVSVTQQGQQIGQGIPTESTISLGEPGCVYRTSPSTGVIHYYPRAPIITTGVDTNYYTYHIIGKDIDQKVNTDNTNKYVELAQGDFQYTIDSYIKNRSRSGDSTKIAESTGTINVPPCPADQDPSQN